MTMPKFAPKDFIALAVLAIFATLRLKGITSWGDSTIALVIGYYFAHRHQGTDSGH